MHFTCTDPYISREKGDGSLGDRGRGHVTRVWQPVNISRTRTKPGDRRRTACHGLSASPYRASVSDPPSPRQGLLRPWPRRCRGFSKYSCPLGWSIFFVHCYQIFLRFRYTIWGILLWRKDIGRNIFRRETLKSYWNVNIWFLGIVLIFFFLRIETREWKMIEICHFEGSLIGGPFSTVWFNVIPGQFRGWKSSIFMVCRILRDFCRYPRSRVHRMCTLVCVAQCLCKCVSICERSGC